MKFFEAFGWGVLCAVAVAVSGFLGHLVGGRVYPQRYEQIPSDFLFIPLGLIVGFVSAATARLARPKWDAAGMLGVVALASMAYAGLMFEYARSRAVPAQVTVTFEPDAGTAVRCDSGACPQVDPPLQWTVQGNVRVQETSGLGGTVDAISLSSYEEVRGRPPTYTREEAVRLRELSKFSGPNVRLTGRQIIGAHHVRPNEVVSYPIRYSYRTYSGTSRRSVAVYVEFTDAAGHWAIGIGQWKVR